jgi:hypothetical protein
MKIISDKGSPKIRFELVIIILILGGLIATISLIALMILSSNKKTDDVPTINLKKSTLELETYDRIIENQKSDFSVQKNDDIGRDNPFDEIESTI